ncbi:hypothetical protein BACCOPRO_02202 [Phocaeicola coprophilus DSM 18228 = JCM 13818]|uniref:Uncharacterized protein n=1 Tax=Phocaeicola coprophilus DSM 18228 = JCM 13818 TaxID=547042 RepID=S0FDU1_9BACT|nr:hypothetical protein BACCOPRO_02202 [Phocaeicola coprophilus DSM 18228 = JCM 13818]
MKKRARLFKKDFGLCSQTPKRFDEKPETFFARKKPHCRKQCGSQPKNVYCKKISTPPLR